MKKTGKIEHTDEEFRKMRASNAISNHEIKNAFKEHLANSHDSYSHYENAHKKFKLILYGIMVATAILVIVVLKRFNYI